MEVVRGMDSLPLRGVPSAVTIGFFDGVHRGHQAVIRRTVENARVRGLWPAAVTFDRHPLEVLSPGKAPLLINTLERRGRLIAALGVDAMVVLEFTEELSRWSPQDFVDKVLVEGLHAEHVVVGANFTFGHKALGNLSVLSDMGMSRGFTAEGVTLLKLDGRAVSSSSVREALADGDLEWTERALGRKHIVDGRVVAGAGRGAGLGWPTANLEVEPRILLPAEGVYAGKAYLADGGARAAAVNVGGNPTFGGEPIHLEAYLLDFEGDLTGAPLSVEMWARLRDEIRFESPRELSEQIGEDVRRTRELIEAGAPEHG